MTERRAAERMRSDAVGSIAVDEHTSLACLIYDISDVGIRITLPQAETVPARFVLDAPCLGDAARVQGGVANRREHRRAVLPVR